ncbi:MAG TPA: SPOR domain-containing protein, partial [Pseudorhodoferax sp.]|nr:SPOR domain-containing protein [Pseudorhodoferax sp.]
MQHATGPQGPEDGPQDVSAQLYRAALGPDPQDHYLRRFQARDAGTRTQACWHWGACACAPAWLAWRGLFGLAALWACAALLGGLLVLGLARLVFGAGSAALGALVLALLALASLGWGWGAEALYHRVSNRRIVQAVQSQASVAAACAQLQRSQPGALRRWAAMLAWGAAVLALLAGLGQALRASVPDPVSAAAQRTATAATAAKPMSAPAAASPDAAPAPAPAPAPEPAPVAALPQPQPEPEPSSPVQPMPTPEAAPAAPTAPDTRSAAATPVPAPPPASPPASRASATADGARYAVQIGIFAQPDNARDALARLRAAGFSARAERANDQGHQRVRA